MDSKYYIRALTDKEIQSLLKDRKFNILHPVKCNNCGNESGFQQKLFRVDTEPKKIDIDESQGFLRYHMKQRYNYDFIFFKIRKNVRYIDTAFCEKCNSNLITYDIDLGNEEFEKLSKYLKVPKEKLQNDIREIQDKLESEH